jgi:protein-S-isoprenylcysteine O-methyltransferase Ste14
MDGKHFLELKIPPAGIFIVFMGAMYLLAQYLPVGEFDFFGNRELRSVLAIAGLIIGVLAVLQFAIKRTPADPFHPERAGKLVTRGVYNYSRNPMYLALLLLLLAWGLHLGNAFNTLLAALFVAYMNRFQIGPEERALEKKFGSAYRQYTKLVRRWF